MTDLTQLKNDIPERYTLSTFTFDDIRLISFIDDMHLMMVGDKPVVIDCNDMSLHDGRGITTDSLRGEIISYSSNGAASMPHQSVRGDLMAMVAHRYPLRTVVYMPLGVSCFRQPDACYALMASDDVLGFGFNGNGRIMVAATKTLLKIYTLDA